MDFTLDINTLVGVGVALIVAVVGATWHLGQKIGGLERAVTDGARNSSETHERLGNAITDVGRRVDRVLENQNAQGGGSGT